MISSPFVLYQDFKRAPTNEGGQSYPFLGFGKKYVSMYCPNSVFDILYLTQMIGRINRENFLIDIFQRNHVIFRKKLKNFVK